jgi:putative peptidoglycan lipid II flippase
MATSDGSHSSAQGDQPEFGVPPEEGPGQALDRDTGRGTVLRSSAVMAVGTVISRITGVGRDIALVAALGFGTLADVYTLGNTLPNSVYLLLVGGALGAVFVPQLVRHLREDDDNGDAYANRLITLTSIVLLVLAITTVIAAPWIVNLYTPNNYSQLDNELATAFARFFLPQIFFYGLYTMLSQVLNSRGHFAMPMFVPILNNIVVICMFIGFIAVVGTASTVESLTRDQLLWLGIGTTAGVVIQALALIPVMSRVSFRFRPRFDFRGSGLGKTAKLAGWTVAMVLANQIALLVTARLAAGANIIASEAGVVEQGLATFDKAYLVFMLPNSVITISIVTAMLPRMSHSAASGELGDVSEQLSDSARLISSLIVPAAAILIAFGPLVTTVVFAFGAGAGPAATYTGVVVSAFAFGLPSFALFYLLIRGWYALSDTRSPFVVTALFNGLLIVFAIVFYEIAPPGLKVVSLAVAETIASWIGLFVAWAWLSRRVGGLQTRRTVVSVAKMMLAGTAGAALGFLGALAFRAFWSATQLNELNPGQVGGPLLSAVSLVIGVAITMIVYLGMSRLLLIEEVNNGVRMVTARIPGLRR